MFGLETCLANLISQAMRNVSDDDDIPVEGVEDFKVVLIANNLLDEIARNHSSTVKNEVPLPGKNLGIGFRVTL